MNHKNHELGLKNRKFIEVEKQNDEYKNRLSQYQVEKSVLQRQMMKLKQEINERKDLDGSRTENEAKMEWVLTENSKLTEQVNYLKPKCE